MPALSPFALALLGQLPQNDGADQEPDQDVDDFGKWAIAEQAQRADLAKRKQVQQSKMAADQGSLLDRLMQNPVDSRPQPTEPPNEFQSPKIFNPFGERVANPGNKAPIAAVLQQPSEESLLDSSLKIAGPQSLVGLIGNATSLRQERPEGVEWLPRFSGTNAPPPKPLTPSRLNTRGNAKVAENPYDTLDSSEPEQSSLQDRLAGMTLQHPEARNIPAKQAAKREAGAQAQWELEDKEQERYFAAKKKSQATSQNAGQRNFLDSILGRTEASGKSRSDELYDDTMSEFRNRQTLSGRNAGMGNSAAMYAGTPRYNAKLPGVAKPAVDEEAATQAEFEHRKQAAKDRHGDYGPMGVMVKKNAKPQNLSGAQRLNLQQIGQRGEQQSARNLAALLAGSGGQNLQEGDADLKTLRAYSAGLKKGPTLVQAMMMNRDDTQSRRAEAERNGKIAQLARLTEAHKQSNDPKLKTLIDVLEVELASGNGGKSSGLPKVQDKYSDMELADMAKSGVRRLPPKTSSQPKKQDEEKKPVFDWGKFFAALSPITVNSGPPPASFGGFVPPASRPYAPPATGY